MAAGGKLDGHQLQHDQSADRGGGDGRWLKAVQRPRWLDVRAVTALSLTASALLPPGAPLVLRTLKLAPLLYMLPTRP